MRGIYFILLIWIAPASCQKEDEPGRPSHTPFLNAGSIWVDSVLTEMSLEEKIGQLIILKSGNDKPAAADSIYSWVLAGKLGGLLLNDMPLPEFTGLTNSCRKAARVPLFIGTEEKVLLNNQFSGLYQLPSAQTVSAVSSDSLKSRMQLLYAKQAYALGINFSFSPSISWGTPVEKAGQEIVFDPFSKEDAPVHRLESFNLYQILSIADEFSASFLLKKDTGKTFENFLLPYLELVKSGVAGFCIDDALFQVDTLERLPKYFLKNFFRKELQFKGLIVASMGERSEMSKLIHAGTDLFVVEKDPTYAFEYLKYAVQMGVLSPEAVNDKVRKILKAKVWMRDKKQNSGNRLSEKTLTLPASLSKLGAPVVLTQPLSEDALLDHFASRAWRHYTYNLYKESLILLNNHHELLPFTGIYKRPFRLVHYGEKRLLNFRRYFYKYADFSSRLVRTEKGLPLPPFSRNSSLKRTYVFTLDELIVDPERDGAFISSVKELAKDNKVVLINFGDPRNLQAFDTSLTILQVFERNNITESMAAQLLFGAVTANGKLPLDINAYFRLGQGITNEKIRLKYALPEEAGIAPEKLVGIDAIAKTAIEAKAFPGCQILIAKAGKIIYSKTFGNHEYNDENPVLPTDLYDLASITKVAATTLAAMQLYEKKKFRLNDKLREHLSLDKRSTIKNIPIKKLLTHQSGLQPNMPIAPYLLLKDKTNILRDSFFLNAKTDTFALQVADTFYFHKYFRDTIWEAVKHLQLNKSRRFRYSDVNFMLLKEVVESKVGNSLDSWINQNFYFPLGLRRSAFKPLQKFDSGQIVPTQNDVHWRRQLLRGYVHDETAALFGGVGGNAGLFSNAEDLATIFQMLLNGGTYGGRRFLNPETVQLFTSARHGNHRGLGFDKPYPGSRSAYAKSASASSYGHTGFTGTCVWVDPEQELIFIFLSNRIYPDVTNRKLLRLKVRERIHQIIYDALDTYKVATPDLEVDLGKVNS